MSEVQWLGGFMKAGAMLEGHFVYASGKHGERYFNKDLLYLDPEHVHAMGHGLANAFSLLNVDVVVAPELGAIVLGQATAHWLKMLDGGAVKSVIAEKARDGTKAFKLGRGYADHIVGKRALVVEDVLTTGGSVKEVIKVVRDAGGTVIGVGAICNRGGVRHHDLGVERLVSLVELDLKMWDEAECPLCRDGVPINTGVGKGKDFLAKQEEKRLNPLVTDMIEKANR